MFAAALKQLASPTSC